jgi:hypothetical protein
MQRLGVEERAELGDSLESLVGGVAACIVEADQVRIDATKIVNVNAVSGDRLFPSRGLGG